jgi:hypothetical protein
MQDVLSDGAHEPFTVGVQIGTPWWQDDGFHATVLQQRIERLGIFGIPIAHQIPLAQQKSVNRIRQLPGALLHESCGGMSSDAGNLDPPRGQCHDEKDIIGHQAMWRPPP